MTESRVETEASKGHTGHTALVNRRRVGATRGVRLRRSLGITNIGAVYLAAVLFATFAFWLPDTFLTRTSLGTTLGGQAVTAMVAIGLVVSLGAGCYDLSIGYSLGISSTVAAVLMSKGTPGGLAILAAIGAALLLGLVNAVIVVLVKVDSIIVTLGTGSIASGVVLVISDQPVYGVSSFFQEFGYQSTFSIPWIFYFLIIIAIIAWYILEHTPVGRYLYATGANAEAARLAGVPTSRYQFVALVVSSLCGGLAGLMLTARVSGSSPDYGGTYLLPAFAAAFFGATQLKSGRPNIIGTLLAVYALAIGTTGFSLLGASTWIQNVFYGAALLGAVVLSMKSGGQVGDNIRRLLRLRRGRETEPGVGDGVVNAQAPPTG